MKKSNVQREQRRSRRVQITSNLRFQTSRELGAKAQLLDVDQGGMRIKTGLFIAVGSLLMLDVENPSDSGKSVELKGRVVWVSEEGPEFQVGIRVYQDVPDVRIVLCTLMCAALKKQAAVSKIRDRNFVYAEWKLAVVALETDSGTSSAIWTARKQAKVSGRVLALGY
jgi:hypothetical protein